MIILKIFLIQIDRASLPSCSPPFLAESPIHILFTLRSPRFLQPPSGLHGNHVYRKSAHPLHVQKCNPEPNCQCLH
ncbi:unnamed protein product, partial [Vitis vinifera]